jgi:threonyl-tRNA synthetase
VPVAQARERFLAERQDYKVELIDDLVTRAPRSLHREPLETVSLYTNGPFTDLCRGPHAPSTGAIGAFKLQSVAGAYWRGDSSRTMLTRIYGTAFFSKAELEAHLERLEQARARDHRKLGRELDLFMFSEVSPGAPSGSPPAWRSGTPRGSCGATRTAPRLPRGEDADPLRRRAVAQSGTGTSTASNMYFTDVEERRWRSSR